MEDSLLEEASFNRNPEKDVVSILFSIMDPARVVIFIISIFIIYYGSHRAVKLDKDIKESPIADGVQNLSCFHVVSFPIVGSLVLLVMFYFFEYIQFIYMILCIVVSTTALLNFIYPLVGNGIDWLYRRQTLNYKQASSPVWIASIISITLTTLWVLTGHWMCLDALGIALCVLMIQFVRVPSLKVSSLLLIGLLLYDIFWVFYSSRIFSANVMVEVAIKKANNPLAVVGEKLNLPSIIKSRPPLSIPGKLLVPSFFHDDSLAMLGLGDIVLPGLLLCFSMRFDAECTSIKGRGSISSGLAHTSTRCLILCQKWSYFCTCMIGYALGLLTASVVADLYKTAQPAMLYLVPGVLIPMFLKAFLQGDLHVMWTGPFESDHGLPTSRDTDTETKSYHHIGQYSSLLPS